MSQTKQHIRDRVWQQMEKTGVRRFPGTHGRIPNFVGAELAAERLSELDIWKRSKALKCNPDSPQHPGRLLALREGKIVYMAVPRLREMECFIELDPSRLGRNIAHASSIKGAFRFGRPVLPHDMRPIDLIVCGTVAVNLEGARIGKGGGYSDLEYALARDARLVSPKTPIVTTVHDLQVLDEELPVFAHDIPVDYVVTPTKVIQTHTRLPRPKGIYWDYLTKEKIDAIPYLKQLRSSSTRRSP